MNPSVLQFVRLVISNKEIDTKEEMKNIVLREFPNMVKDGRALYHTDVFAVVFCYSKNKAFSNVVLSLSKLQKYDGIPCFVVVVKKELDNAIYLINTTFLDKISHSSRDLRINNIRGSLLGSNVRKYISELNKSNSPENFEDLFALHSGYSWQDNIERLVENTNNIKPVSSKTILGKKEMKNLLASPERANRFAKSADYSALLNDLRMRCEEVKDAIIVASHIDNVNIRGRLIEILITSDNQERSRLLQNLKDVEHRLPVYDTKNDLGDYTRRFPNSDTYTDVKTKIIYLDSNPKAYNIDKFLNCMAQEKSVFMLFFVGIDENGISNTILASVFHKELMDTTILQHHWAGRGTRGTAQFYGKTINRMLSERQFQNSINQEDAKAFLKSLLDR